MTTRRDLLHAAATLPLAAVGTAHAATPRAKPVDLGFLRGNALLNRERASAQMRREGLVALLVSRAANVFYLTNTWPLLERMGGQGTAFAVLPADPQAPIALVMGQFSYYYGVNDDPLPGIVKPFLYTSAADAAATGGAEPAAAPPRMFRVIDEAALLPRERARRLSSEAAAPFSAAPRWALARALRELKLESGRIGVDDWLAQDALALAAPSLVPARAEDTLRRIRRVKSETEVRLMRLAAQSNADAALAAARATREAGSMRAVRARYYSEATQRGLRPVFMVVDGVTSDAYDEPLRDGQSFLIDCVSSLQNYHGDFARTVIIGEPAPRMAMATRAIALCWDEIRAALRPGMRYAAIRDLGNATLKKFNLDVQVGFTPHSVGLWHGDEPRTAEDGGPVDPVVDEGMILSVDCPVFDQGAGGTAHLEDLSLITAAGAQLINSPEHRTIQV